MSKVIRSLYLFLFFFTPLIFTSFNSELFELPKMYFVYLMTILITFFHLFSYLQGQHPLFRRTILDLPLIIFIISQIISTLLSVDPHTSIYGYYSRLNGGLISLLAYALLYWILQVHISPSFSKKIITAFLSSGFLVSLYGILQHFGIDKHLWVQDVQSRVFSTLGQPNWLSAYLCILLPFSLDSALNKIKEKKYLPFTVSGLLFAVYYLCLLFTKSKSGLIAAAISLVIYFSLNLFQNKFKNIRHQIPFLLLIAILSLTIHNPIRDLIFSPSDTNSPTETPVSNLIITPSEDIRKIVWAGAVELWKKYPYFGTGVETFAYSYYWTRSPSHNLTSEWDFLYNKAHNEYLNFLATTGIFGLTAYLLLLISIFRLILKSAPKNPLFLPLLTAVVSILITNFAGFSVVVTSLFLFLLPGLYSPPAPVPVLPTKPTWLRFPLIILTLIALQRTVFHYLADIYYSQSLSQDNKAKYQSALALAGKALSLRPDEPIYLSHLSDLESKVALITKETDHISRAIDLSNQALTLSPANLNLWKERAQMFYYLSTLDSQYFPYAIDALEKVNNIAPTDAKNLFLMGKFYQSASLDDKAIEYYRQALNQKPNYDHAAFALSQIYLQKKDYQKAKDYLNLTLDLAPANEEAKNLLIEIATASARQP